MDFKISCESTLALDERKSNGLAFKTTDLRIYYTDMCKIGNVSAATRGNYQIPLYQLSGASLTQASIDVPGCPTPIINTIRILSSTAVVNA